MNAASLTRDEGLDVIAEGLKLRNDRRSCANFATCTDRALSTVDYAAGQMFAVSENRRQRIAWVGGGFRHPNAALPPDEVARTSRLDGAALPFAKSGSDPPLPWQRRVSESAPTLGRRLEARRVRDCEGIIRQAAISPSTSSRQE